MLLASSGWGHAGEHQAAHRMPQSYPAQVGPVEGRNLMPQSWFSCSGTEPKYILISLRMFWIHTSST